MLQLKSVGLFFATKLMFLCDFLIELCIIKKDYVKEIENFSHWLYGISYNGSKKEIEDALNLRFENDWKCYNEFQLNIIKYFGIVEQVLNYNS